MREKQARPRLVGRCPSCRKVQPLTRHHIVPRSEGGPDEDANIELLCRSCHNALHRMSAPRRSVSREQRQARKTRIKAYRAQVKFECRPLVSKCRDCQAVCMNFVLELLAIFFRWLDEVTSQAMGTASA